MTVLLTCLIAWLPFSNSFCEIPKMHTNYHTVGFFLETEMIHFFKKMFSFLNSFLHFQVIRKCPILNTLSMTMEGLFWSILVKFILKKKKVMSVCFDFSSECERKLRRKVSLAFNHDVIKENVNGFLCLVFPFFIKHVLFSEVLDRVGYF